MKNNFNGVKIVCAECGSDDVLERAWFNPNTSENFGWDEGDECYCKHCCKMTAWKEISEN